MKTSTGLVSKSELMHSANLATVVLGVSVSVSMTGNWDCWRLIVATLHEGPGESLFALLYLAFGVYTVGSFYQIAMCRRVGPGVYASFSAIRIVVAVISSRSWLKEPIESLLVWIGLLEICGAVTWYTVSLIGWGKDKVEEIKLSRSFNLTGGLPPGIDDDDMKRALDEDDSTVSSLIYSVGFKRESDTDDNESLIYNTGVESVMHERAVTSIGENESCTDNNKGKWWYRFWGKKAPEDNPKHEYVRF